MARHILIPHEPHDGIWPTEYLPTKWEKAREKFVPLFQEDAEFRELSNGYAGYTGRTSRYG